MTDDERNAEIRRLFYGEHWKIGTIAKPLGIHRDDVSRVIESDRYRKHGYHAAVDAGSARAVHA